VTRLLFVFVLVFAPVAVSAQTTGSSFGGGSFGGGGGSSFGSSGSSWSGSSGSSWSSSGSSWSSSGSSYSGGGFSWFHIVLSILVIVISIAIRVAKENQQRSDWTTAVPHDYGYSSAPSPMNRMDVTALSIAVDWRARAHVQQALDTLARRANTGTSAGLHHALTETLRLVREVRLAWLYAGVQNAQPMRPSDAEQHFRRWSQDARSRFRHELVRNADGSTKLEETPEVRAREEEGEGVVVVTLVVAARKVIPDIHHAEDARRLDHALAALSQVSVSELAAIEVIWSPSAANDRMSTAELAVLYPELVRIAEASIGGRVFCNYCSGPFAQELPRCPHCGAPNDARAAG